jgi:hypothetical protein
MDRRRQTAERAGQVFEPGMEREAIVWRFWGLASPVTSPPKYSTDLLAQARCSPVTAAVQPANR